MDNFGFIKVSAAIPFGKVGDIAFNKNEIISLIKAADSQVSSLVVFPELTITGYTLEDLFHQREILDSAQAALFEIIEATKNLSILSVIGIPLIHENKLLNTAAVINRGKLLGVVPKTYLPSYREFYERRWFASGDSVMSDTVALSGEKIPIGTNLLFTEKKSPDLKIGIEICEDLWVPIPPSSYQALSGATILCNLSASNVLVGKHEYRKDLVQNQSGRCIAGYVYVSAGMGESTKDVVFDAHAIIAENSITLAESERFLRKSQLITTEIDCEKLITERIKLNYFTNSEKDFKQIEFEGNSGECRLTRAIHPHPFVPSEKQSLDSRCREIFNIQSSGLAKRLETLKGIRAVIGVSGGLDSTLALLVTIKAFQLVNRELNDILAVTMPGFGTTDRTYSNIVELCKLLRVSFEDISIKTLSQAVFDLVQHDSANHNLVYENVQARARTYILMTLANQKNGMVIGTGDMSEIALGFCTYTGDHISMYNVNSSVPKTLVKFLVQWIAETEFDSNIQKLLLEIVNQPISPELLPGKGNEIVQKTEDIIGPYELHDFYLFYFVRYGFSPEKIEFLASLAFKEKYSPEIIRKYLKLFLTKFFSNQWKRDCVPAGPKIGSIDLSPRGSWRMPSELSIAEFLKK